MRGVPAQNTKPIASAPARAAASAVGSRSVMPQILTRVRRHVTAARRAAATQRTRASRASPSCGVVVDAGEIEAVGGERRRAARAVARRRAARRSTRAAPCPRRRRPARRRCCGPCDAGTRWPKNRNGCSRRSRSIAAARERLHRRLRLALRGAERAEIVRADQRRGAVAHRGDVERPMVPADAPREDRRAHRPVDEQVRVMARDGGEARVEIGVHAARPEHGDLRRQVRIDAAHPGRVGTRRRGVEVHDLHRRVHAGVGAAGGDRADALIGDRARARARAHPARPARPAATASR